MADIPVIVVSENSRSERRVTPSWTVSHLKNKLETVTGIPASCQKLTIKTSSNETQSAEDDNVQLSTLELHKYSEIQVEDTRGPSAQINLTDVSAVEKYVMPKDEYETRSDSVLAWKKTQRLGRFDPTAATVEEQRASNLEREVTDRGITKDCRCRLLPETDNRRGTVKYVGPIPELPGSAGPWVGVELDEPVGKNDGSVDGHAYFQCLPKFGVFIRPDRIEAGDFPPLADLGEEMEEI